MAVKAFFNIFAREIFGLTLPANIPCAVAFEFIIFVLVVF